MGGRSWVLTTWCAVAVACGPIDVTECPGMRTESRCEEVEVDGIGACHWVDVFTPIADGDSCDPGEPSGLCVGITGTQAGCGLLRCDEAAGEGPNAYHRTRDGETQVFASPECGPQPVGDWTSCVEGDTPVECGCLCGVAQPPGSG